MSDSFLYSFTSLLCQSVPLSFLVRVRVKGHNIFGDTFVIFYHSRHLLSHLHSVISKSEI